MKNKVITRIAPSPTGKFHIGTARSALFNFLYAKKHNGDFVVRIEDTDKERSKKEYEEDILNGMKWLGLQYDRIERQSERTEIYEQKLKEVIDSGTAYVSKEPAKDNPEREVEVVRLKNPGKEIVFQDEIRGEITFDTTELGDFVIARSISEPLYHFAVVVDDALMEISHVIRGEDHISNTPRQILIQEALGIERPVYAHVPLILAPDKSKMSKRKGAVSITEYREMGFSPQAINNYIALLGWNPGTQQEVFTLNELIEVFSLDHIQKGGAVFDIEKLKWIQKEQRTFVGEDVVKKEFLDAISDYKNIQNILQSSEKALQDVLDRFALTSEFLEAIREGEFDFYKETPSIEKEKVVWKKDNNPEKVPERLDTIITLLTELTTFDYDSVKGAVWDYADSEGKGDVLWPMRYALSGCERSPDPFLLSEALGKDETIKRLKAARDLFV